MNEITSKAALNILSLFKQLDSRVPVPILPHNGGRTFVYQVFNKESCEWFLNKRYWVSPKLFRKSVFDDIKKKLDLSSGG